MASTNIEIFKWTTSATETLLDLIKRNYERLNSGVKKATYQEIADTINAELGTDLNHGQIDSKWKGLKRTFRKIREYTYKTGRTRSWRFYDKVEEILALSEDIETPPQVLSTENGNYSDESVAEFVGFNENEANEEFVKIESSNEEEAKEEVTDEGEEDLSSEPDVKRKVKYEEPPRKRRRYIEIDAREDAIERRHRERIEVANRFNDIFEEMVRKMR